jgi:hypothetical protein
MKRRAGFVTGAERDATDPSRLWAFRAGLGRLRQKLREVVKGRRPADEVGGPRIQQCGDAKHSVKAPSAWRRWELQADKTVACGTLAKTFVSGPVQPDGLDHRPCAVARRHTGLPVSKTCGRRGRGFRPVVPHAPFGEKEQG